MKHAWTFFALVAMALSGCNTGPWDAPPGTIIGELEGVKVPWFGCQINPETGEAQNPNCDVEQPSSPVAIPYTVVILNGETELPVNNVWVRVASIFEDIYILPQEVIEAVALPDTDNWSRASDGGAVWAELSGDWEGDYRSTFMEAATDAKGQVDFWIWVQKMPLDPQSGQAKESVVIIDIGVDRQEIALQAGA